MDDYEQENALEWDLNQGGEKARSEPEGTWQVVGGPKEKQQQFPPRLPFAQPPTIWNKQLPDNIHGQGMTAQAGSPEKKVLPKASLQKAPSQAPTQAATVLGNQLQQQKTATKSSPILSKGPNQQAQGGRPRQQQSPSKWQGRQRNAKQQPRAPRMTQSSDNPGEQLWRDREKARRHVLIPFEPAELALKTQRHIKIAQRHGTFVLKENEQGGNESMSFGIWGNAKVVEATIKDINAWVKEFESSQKLNNSGKFAKIRSLTDTLRVRAEKAWEREVKRHRYRQYPPPGKGFPAIGTFYWPVKDYKPEEILGMNYEALDPIRMECQCYVVFNQTEGLFQVMGKAEAVKVGLIRLRGTCFQIAARQIAAVELYYLHDGTSNHTATENVTLREYEGIRVLSGENFGNAPLTYSPRTVSEDSDVPEMASQRAVTKAAVRKSILTSLTRLHYYRGSIQMRIRFGTFLATWYKKSESGVFSIQEYASMIKEPQFHGEVTQELGNRAVEATALSTLQGAAEFLSPQDPMAANLTEVKPLYTAVFTFADPMKSETGDIRLTVTWEEVQDSTSELSSFEPKSKKWTRLEQDNRTTNAIFDINLSDLTSGMAWQFEMSAAQSIEEARLPPGLSDFGDQVKPDEKAARKIANLSTTDMSFVQIGRPSSYLKHIEQRITYQFRDIESDYTLELTRFQHCDFQLGSSLISPSAQRTLYEPRWSLSVYRIEWDTMLTKNERLRMGEKADWSHEEDAWFPKDNSTDEKPGFATMMEKLNRIASLMTEEKHLMGGMTVG